MFIFGVGGVGAGLFESVLKINSNKITRCIISLSYIFNYRFFIAMYIKSVFHAAQNMYKENVILTVNCCIKVVPLRETYIELFLLTTKIRFYVTSAAILAGKRHNIPFCISLYFVA